MKRLPAMAYGPDHGWHYSGFCAAVRSVRMVSTPFQLRSTTAIIGICLGVIGKSLQENMNKTFFFEKENLKELA